MKITKGIIAIFVLIILGLLISYLVYTGNELAALYDLMEGIA